MRVRLAPAETGMFWDRDDTHPDGEVQVLPGAVAEVAETPAVMMALAAGRLVRADDGAGTAPPATGGTDAAPRPTCQGTKQDGEPCSQPAMANGYCRFHGGSTDADAPPSATGGTDAGGSGAGQGTGEGAS